MEELKFELSVIFVKFGLNCYTNNELIKKKYESYFRKEVNEECFNRVISDIVEDQIEFANNFIVEIPEDFELINTNNDLRNR